MCARESVGIVFVQINGVLGKFLSNISSNFHAFPSVIFDRLLLHIFCAEKF